MQQVEQLKQQLGVVAACEAMGVSRSNFYRHERPSARPVTKTLRTRHPRALNPVERAEVITTLSSERFVDCAPAAVHAVLLDEEKYLCSVRTMYRILHENSAVRERRAQRRHPTYEAPQLLATCPNQVWSWDITKLPGTAKFENYHLYVMMDIFSRYIVGYLVAERESGELAKEFIATCCKRQGINSKQLTIHSDRGAAMMSRPVVGLLNTLDVHKTVSRPHVSNDNPFIESHFKTLKYRPCFPRRFGSIQDARATLRPFFDWYNSSHRHSGIGYLTPDALHHGRGPVVLERRAKVLEAAYSRNRERFVRGQPMPASMPEAVWINPPKQNGDNVKSGSASAEVSSPACSSCSAPLQRGATSPCQAPKRQSRARSGECASEPLTAAKASDSPTESVQATGPVVAALRQEVNSLL